MKKTIAKIISFTLIATIILSFSGCFSSGEKKDPANDNVSVSDSATVESLKAAKIATFTGRTNHSPYAGGLSYYDGEAEKYGVISLDGQYDTGAKYARTYFDEGYFQVSYKKYTGNASDMSVINNIGLIDGKGNTLAPHKYAYILMLNENYAKVYTAEARCYSKDDAIVAYDGSIFTLWFDEEDEMFSGKWEVLDVKNQKIIAGVNSSTADYVSAYGNYLSYTELATDDRYFIDANGNKIEADTMFEDGSYTIEKNEGTVYANDGSKLFTYQLSGFTPYVLDSGYYIADKYEDSVSTYVVMDTTGKVVSAEFKDKSIDIYGNFIFQDGKLYNFDGSSVIEGTYSSCKYDYVFGNAVALRFEDDYVILNNEGKVLLKDSFEKDTEYPSIDNIAAYKKIDDKYMAYSFADKDYTIEGTPFAPFLIETKAANSIHELVDSTNGKVLITGYKSYSKTIVNEHTMYVYATVNGITDVYVVVKESEFVDYEQLKTDLLGDLVDAFNAEGITVTVDKTTGELALDSSVLFGGDSAVLTDDGKSLLDKFMKAYTSIIYNDKYKNFVQDTIIEGHTAPVPGTTYEDGIDLSIERAENVLNYCVALKTSVDTKTLEDTFTSIGYSCSKPVFDENGEVVMDACRRVSFRIIVDTDAYN